MLLRSVITLFAMLAELAFPIGRVGNNGRFQNIQEGYSFILPQNFLSVSKVQDGGAIFASGLFASSPPVPVDIQMLPFRTKYKNLVGKGKRDIENYFRELPEAHFEKLNIANGALNFFAESKSSYIAISVCGDGRGFLMFAQKLDLNSTAMLEALESTEFDKPCLN